jgi:hypothetical protein
VPAASSSDCGTWRCTSAWPSGYEAADFIADRLARYGVVAGSPSSIALACAQAQVCFNLMVADQQRIYDAILTGEPRPFQPQALPTFAQIYRMGS